jgi:hypothetical protein
MKSHVTRFESARSCMHAELQQRQRRYLYVHHVSLKCVHVLLFNTHACNSHSSSVPALVITHSSCRPAEQILAFSTDAVNSVVEAYCPIVKKHMNDSFTEEQKQWQQIRRGRWVLQDGYLQMHCCYCWVHWASMLLHGSHLLVMLLYMLASVRHPASPDSPVSLPCSAASVTAQFKPCYITGTWSSTWCTTAAPLLA